MSREIKFRAWNKEKKIMCYDNEGSSSCYWGGAYPFEVGIINRYMNLPECLRDCEYMQYIGIFDKNGRGIYEGDIVLVGMEDEYFVVEWDNDTARFVMNSETLTVDFDNYWGYQVEIIGNVYEDADLLKEVDG